MLQSIILKTNILTIPCIILAGFFGILIVSVYINYKRNRCEAIHIAGYAVLSLCGIVTIIGLMLEGYILMLLH